MPVKKRPIINSSGISNLTHRTLTTAPTMAGTFDTSTDLFLYTHEESHTFTSNGINQSINQVYYFSSTLQARFHN